MSHELLPGNLASTYITVLQPLEVEASLTVWGHKTTQRTTTVSVHTNIRRWTLVGKFGQDSPCAPA